MCKDHTADVNADRRQLECMQRVGGVGYWEYATEEQNLLMPEASQQLLRHIAGGGRKSYKSLLEFLAPSERQRFQHALSMALAKKLAFNLELVLQGDGAQVAYVAVRGAPMPDDAGVPGIAGTFQDITPAKRIESEREQLITQMQALLDALPQGVSVVDSDLRLILWNRRFYEILGFPQSLVFRYARFEDFIRYNAMRGEYGPGDPQEQIKAIVDRAREFQPHRFERNQTGGGTLLVEGFPFSFDGAVSGFVTTYTDISERKQSEGQLTRQRDVMKTIIDNFPGAISLFDADLRMAACNAQFKTLMDLPNHLFMHGEVHFEDLIRFNAQRGEYGPGDVEVQTAASLERARNFQAHHMERPRPDGKWLEITGTPIPSGGFVTSYIDITERKKAEERIRVLALQDGLTGLPNRLSWNESLEQALARAAESDQRFAVLFLDLDGFKKVNDTCGHDVGDALLVHVAQLLKNAVRTTDTVARLGGDEFVILLHDVTGADMVGALAEKIVGSVAQTRMVKGAAVEVGTSVGIALYPDHADSREGLLKVADQAMYAVKTHGKGGYRFGESICEIGR